MDKPYTVDELLTRILEDNYEHFMFIHKAYGGYECDCHIHNTVRFIEGYL